MGTPAEGRCVVGVLRLTLHIPGAHSLKEKRHVLRSVIDGVHTRFNVAAAEIASLDAHQRAEIGVAAVANAPEHAHSVLQSVLNRLDGRADFEIIESDIEML